jgi:hypothetical protein
LHERIFGAGMQTPAVQDDEAIGGSGGFRRHCGSRVDDLRVGWWRPWRAAVPIKPSLNDTPGSGSPSKNALMPASSHWLTIATEPSAWICAVADEAVVNVNNILRRAFGTDHS